MVSWKQGRSHSRKRQRRSNRTVEKISATLGISKESSRIDGLRIFFVTIGAIIVIRLFTVQILHNSYYEALAFDNHKLFEEIFPERGEIFVQDKYSDSSVYAIATNKTLAEVHAEPIHITDPKGTAEALAPLLNIAKEDLLVQLDKPGDPDEILKRRVPEEVVDAIEQLDLSGITFRQEQWRYYPEGRYAAHLTGYFGYSDDDRKGQYGLEGYFNEELTGTPGYLDGEKDALGRFLTIGESFVEQAQDGEDLVLTIDKNVQFYACERLAEDVETYGAKGGTVIVMQPDTGAILAMCNAPTYDPNTYNEVESIDVFNNAAVSKVYEPGSVMKAFTLAAGLDRGVITPDSTYVDTGEVKIGRFTIRNSDYKANGTQTMTEVLTKSLNTGTIHIAELLGDEAMYQYFHNFGFSEPTGIELAGEQVGDLSGLAQLKDIYTATASYGQGMTVTPLQLITAYAALANGGTLVKPYIVEKRILSNGEEIVTQPETVRRVISANTSKVISAMLVNVIDEGHSITASVPGYYMGGKTGTAQVAVNGSYDANLHNDTFVGYGPIEDPEFIMLTHFEEPANKPWADSTAAPTWGKIAQYIVNYYQIPPDRAQ